MSALWKQIKVYAKTVAVFLAGVLGPPLLRIFTGEDPLPQNKQEWINWLGAIAVSTAAAALTRNKITQSQLDKDPGVAPGAKVVPESPANVITEKSDIDDTPPPSPGLGGGSVGGGGSGGSSWA